MILHITILLLQHFVLDHILIYISFFFTITILGLAVGMAVEVPFAEKPELSVSNVLSLMCAMDQNVSYVVSQPSAISRPFYPNDSTHLGKQSKQCNLCSVSHFGLHRPEALDHCLF